MILFWLIMVLFWTSLMSFYSMQEMACISFNRLRLELAVRSGDHRAIWIKKLLDTPTFLFGTTLIGVNVTLVISSESMRQLFTACGLNPNLSPLIHIPYVLLLGELVPMFAARLFPEHIARLGIPLLRISQLCLTPIIYTIEFLVSLLRRFVFSDESTSPAPYLQRDELCELIGDRGKSYLHGKKQLETIVSRMLTFKETSVAQVLVPIHQTLILRSTTKCAYARQLLPQDSTKTILIENPYGKLIGYTWLWHIALADPHRSVGDLCHNPTFVGETTHLVDLLFQLYRENSHIAFIVDKEGEIMGSVSLEDIITELTRNTYQESHIHLEKTVSARVHVATFLKKYRLNLPHPPQIDFARLVEDQLGRKPTIGDLIYFGPLEIKVTRIGIRGAKTVLIKTKE